MKFLDILSILSQNIDHVYMLEPPRRGGSKEYPQLYYGQKMRKMHTPINCSCNYLKVGRKGVYFSWTLYPC